MDVQSHNVRLTAPELSALWTQYQSDSMSICILSHALEHSKDKEVSAILEYAIGLSESHLAKIKEMLTNESYPLPKGFSKEDVNMNAPPLFSDTFMLQYLYTMALHGMNGYSLSVGTSVRADQRKYFTKCSAETMELYDRILDVMLQKGIFSRPPFINAPHDVDFVNKQSYLTGWFGKRRPLNGIEIGNVYYNAQKTIVKIDLEIGFAQVAGSKELREYFQRGAKICTKHIEIFGSILSEDNLPAPRKWTSEISDSIVSPYSDKLMLFHILSLISVSVGYYGSALSVCQRRDLMVQYTRLMAEIGLYAEDGTNILIKNGWMEQPPTADDRNALSRKK
ncbi:DUF3231 family protein [Litchfieldia alkalitelluris]|uniref:DUF3231 family protein n=1 Tax=Litchfieldia alkalitelluris TaxID=304268 RepID=UPI0009967F78|nr:DUF3231 family protein [Litchfieldia alkalitelluris]